MTRIEKAIITLYDLATRHGASAVSVKREMKKYGFTNDEIAQAAMKIGADNE